MLMIAALWHWPESAKLLATPALLSPVWSMEEAGLMVEVRHKLSCSWECIWFKYFWRPAAVVGIPCCSVTGDFWLAGICWCCTCSKATSPVQWGNSGLCSIQALSVSISLLHISSGVSKGCLRFPLQKFEECLKVKMWDRQKKSIYVTYL